MTVKGRGLRRQQAKIIKQSPGRGRSLLGLLNPVINLKSGTFPNDSHGPSVPRGFWEAGCCLSAPGSRSGISALQSQPWDSAVMF